MATPKKSLSLKTKLIAMSVSALFLAGITGAGIIFYLEKNEKESQKRTFEAFSDVLGDSISAQYFERYGDVQVISGNPAIQSKSKKSIVESLNHFAAKYGIYDLILVVDSSGSLVAVNDKNSSGHDIKVQSLYSKNYSDTPWFKSVMMGNFTEDKARGFSGTFVEDPQLDPWASEAYGEKRLGSSFSAPIKDETGKVIGVISTRAGSRWFEAAFKDLYDKLKMQDLTDSKLVLFGKNGLVFYEYTQDSKYDFDHLLKDNLVDLHLQAALLATQGNSGSLIENENIYGYGPIESPKFTQNLGWNAMIVTPTDQVFGAIHKAEKTFYVLFTLVMGVLTTLIYLFSVGLSKKLMSLASSLSDGGNEVANTASQIADSSHQLSEASVRQASAIQETAASIDEVSAMVKKNSENAAQSQETSSKSRVAADNGQKAVQRMSDAISDISESNEKIMNQVTEGNQKISEIVNLISEIGNKTKVINDIVFQTKLLSFNASVEAARAGEHGKGFAVVAEEVGNLAQMSGNAAREIAELLDGSIQKVEMIINETKSSVDRLVSDGKTRIETGKITAKECGETLSVLMQSVQNVDGMVSEIAGASREQAQGVEEINRAINELDQSVQQNTAVSQTSSRSAAHLNSQSQKLKEMVGELFFVVNGTSQTETPAPVKAIRKEVKSAASEPNIKKLEIKAVRQVEKSKKNEMRAQNTLTQRKNEPVVEVIKEQPVQHKMAVGETSTPSHNDPRFEDI